MEYNKIFILVLIFQISYNSDAQFRKLDAIDSIYINQLNLFKKAQKEILTISSLKKHVRTDSSLYLTDSLNVNLWKDKKNISYLFQQKLVRGISILEGNIYFVFDKRRSQMYKGDDQNYIRYVYPCIRYLKNSEKILDSSDYMEFDFWKLDKDWYYWSER